MGPSPFPEERIIGSILASTINRPMDGMIDLSQLLEEACEQEEENNSWVSEVNEMLARVFEKETQEPDPLKHQGALKMAVNLAQIRQERGEAIDAGKLLRALLR